MLGSGPASRQGLYPRVNWSSGTECSPLVGVSWELRALPVGLHKSHSCLLVDHLYRSNFKGLDAPEEQGMAVQINLQKYFPVLRETRRLVFGRYLFYQGYVGVC